MMNAQQTLALIEGRQSVGLLDLATRLPSVVLDAPVILRGALTGLLALALVYCLLPVFFKLIAAALAWRWRHDLEVVS